MDEAVFLVQFRRIVVHGFRARNHVRRQFGALVVQIAHGHDFQGAAIPAGMMNMASEARASAMQYGVVFRLSRFDQGQHGRAGQMIRENQIEIAVAESRVAFGHSERERAVIVGIGR